MSGPAGSPPAGLCPAHVQTRAPLQDPLSEGMVGLSPILPVSSSLSTSHSPSLPISADLFHWYWSHQSWVQNQARPRSRVTTSKLPDISEPLGFLFSQGCCQYTRCCGDSAEHSACSHAAVIVCAEQSFGAWGLVSATRSLCLDPAL